MEIKVSPMNKIPMSPTMVTASVKLDGRSVVMVVGEDNDILLEQCRGVNSLYFKELFNSIRSVFPLSYYDEIRESANILREKYGTNLVYNKPSFGFNVKSPKKKVSKEIKPKVIYPDLDLGDCDMVDSSFDDIE